jgi:hypothetical protein
MFDVAKTVGLWRHPADAAAIYLQHKVKAGVSKAKAKLQKNRQQQQQGVASGAAGGVGGAAARNIVTAAVTKTTAGAGAATGDKGPKLGLVSMASVMSDNASLIGTAPAGESSDTSLPRSRCGSGSGNSSIAGSSRSAGSAAAASEAGSSDSIYSNCAADGSSSE